VGKTCGPGVDLLFHEAHDELSRLISLPYTRRQRRSFAYPSKSIQSDSSSFILTMLRRERWCSESLVQGTPTNPSAPNSLTMFLVDDTQIDQSEAMLRTLQDNIIFAATALCMPAGRYHGPRLPPDGWLSYWVTPFSGVPDLLPHLLKKTNNPECQIFVATMAMSEETERQIRLLAPNLLDVRRAE
jgi:hypothetical protein